MKQKIKKPNKKKLEKNNEVENKVQDLVKNEEIEKNETNLSTEILLKNDNNTNNYKINEAELEKNDFLNDNDPCLIINNNNESLKKNNSEF